VTARELEGRTALVTGGARGVGREIALALARSGANMALLDRCRPLATTPYDLASRADLEETRAAVAALGVRATAHIADVTDLTAMESVVAQALTAHEALDIVVANAGIFTWGRLWELTEEQWDETIDVNLKGAWVTLKTVVPHLIARGSGRVVCISSTAGLRGGAGIAHYAAAKHGVIGLVRSLAMEVGQYGVTVNAVCPTRLPTAMVEFDGYYEEWCGKAGATRADLAAATRGEQVLPVDFVPVSAVADAVVWLCSPAAACITGAAVPVDAGELLL
jgi:SDR family mycofactocin-dependent oxidoreductase